MLDIAFFELRRKLNTRLFHLSLPPSLSLSLSLPPLCPCLSLSVCLSLCLCLPLPLSRCFGLPVSLSAWLAACLSFLRLTVIVHSSSFFRCSFVFPCNEFSSFLPWGLACPFLSFVVCFAHSFLQMSPVVLARFGPYLSVVFCVVLSFFFRSVLFTSLSFLLISFCLSFCLSFNVSVCSFLVLTFFCQFHFSAFILLSFYLFLFFSSPFLTNLAAVQIRVERFQSCPPCTFTCQWRIILVVTVWR